MMIESCTYSFDYRPITDLKKKFARKFVNTIDYILYIDKESVSNSKSEGIQRNGNNTKISKIDFTFSTYIPTIDSLTKQNY